MCDASTINSFADNCFTGVDGNSLLPDILDGILYFFVAQIFFLDCKIFASKAIQVHSGNQNQIEIHLVCKLVCFFCGGNSDEFLVIAEENVMFF